MAQASAGGVSPMGCLMFDVGCWMLDVLAFGFGRSTFPPLHRIDRGGLNRYSFAMSTQQLTAAAMALPLSERVSLAQALWQSIDAGVAETDEREAVREAIRRDQELSSGAMTGRTHEEVRQRTRAQHD